MKKYLVLYMAPGSAIKQMMETMTDEQQQEDMRRWNDWMSANAANFADQGAPVGKNTRISRTGTEEISNEVLGYSIMQADSKEELLRVIGESNHLDMPGSYTEVMELIDM